MLQKTFTPEWKEWIKTNVDAGHNKDGLFRILHDEGFDYWTIVNALDHVPSQPVEQLVNPLKAAEDRKQAKKTAAQKSNKPQTIIDLKTDTTKSLIHNHGVSIKKSQIFIPNATPLKSNKIDLRMVDNVLDAQDCERLVALIKSGAGDLGEFGAEIDTRLCKLIGIDPAYSQPVRGHFFGSAQDSAASEPTHDIAYDDIEAAKMSPSDLGNRSFTITIFLNAVEAGGGLYFKRLDHEVAPAAGRAVIWNTLTADGRPNKSARCHFKAPQDEALLVLTKSFGSSCEAAAETPFLSREINEYVKNYTREGVTKLRLSDALLDKVQAFYRDNRKAIRDEHVDGDFIYAGGNQKVKRRTSSSLVDLTMELKADIHAAIKPLVEKWSGQKLDPALIYGVREYHEDAVLRMHRDRIETHVFGVIVNVDQDTEVDWPFTIEDNYGRLRHIMFKPGDILFYESCRLSHGRPTAFEGKAYANLFCHFKPVGYEPPVLA